MGLINFSDSVLCTSANQKSGNQLYSSLLRVNFSFKKSRKDKYAV